MFVFYYTTGTVNLSITTTIKVHFFLSLTVLMGRALEPWSIDKQKKKNLKNSTFL